MIRPLASLAATLLFIGTSSVFAASSVDLTVRGLITPSACTPSLSGGGVIDHGKIASKDLSPDLWTSLGSHTLQLAITCEGPTTLALRGIDNQGGAVDTVNGYGLGLIDGKKVGEYVISVVNAMADGAATTVINSSNNGLIWREWSDIVWPLTNLASFGDQSTGYWAPVPVRQVSADLSVYTRLRPTAGMDLTTERPINGSATFEVKYL